MKKLILFLLLFASLFAKDMSFSKETYAVLNSANKQIKAKKYKKAISILKNVKPKKDEEKAYVNATLAQVYLSVNDYKNASKNFEKALSFGVLPKEMRSNTLYNLLQIYLIEKNHKKAIVTYDKYVLHVKKISPEIYAGIATSYLKTKNYNQAIKYIKKALSIKPKNENFMQVLIAIYYEKKDYKHLCSLLESAYRLDILKSLYTKQIAYCLYQNNAPLRGANFLKSAINKGRVKNTKENQKLLFNLYLDAKEYDKAYKLAQKMQDNKISLIIIQSLFDKGKYKQTINATESLKNTQSTKNKALIQMLKAQSYYYLNDKKNALKTFKLALKNPVTKQMARDWIKFISD